MRIIMILLLIFTSLKINNYKMRFKDYEKEMYKLYVAHFNEFLMVDESGEIKFNKESLEEYFLLKGYKVNVVNKNYEICFNLESNIEKKYCFYMVKNNEK